MITGASWADAALLVIDAAEGMRENSRRHAYMLAMLGINQVAVLINKMDMVGYSQERYDKLVLECESHFSMIGLTAVSFIPVSGMEGDNIAERSEHMDWYTSQTVVELLDNLSVQQTSKDKPLRMPVQGCI